MAFSLRVHCSWAGNVLILRTTPKILMLTLNILRALRMIWCCEGSSPPTRSQTRSGLSGNLVNGTISIEVIIVMEIGQQRHHGNPNYFCFLILPARQVDSCPPLEGEALWLLPSNTVQTILVHNHLQKDFRLFQKDFRLFQKDFWLFQKDFWLFQNKCVSHRSCCCSTESCSVLSLSPHVYDQELKKTKQFIIFAFTWQT